MNSIQKRLFEYKDDKYANFQVSLTPGIKRQDCIGVRVPNVRKIAKQLIKDNEHILFLNELPHKYFDENMLHSILLSYTKDYKQCINYIDKFLPYIDNWAVCDSLSPKCFNNNKEDVIKHVKKYIKSKHTFTCRFAIKTLMTYYLNDDFLVEYHKMVCAVKIRDYYINMMQAWYFATALAYRWQDTIIYLENNELDIWTHNKTIQKAIESYRITDKQKQYLKTLKR